MRASAKEEAALKIPDGPKLMPGTSHAQIAIIRKRLKIETPTTKDDGTPADETYYDEALATAVEAYKDNKGIQPVNPAITTALRRSLNSSNDVSETKLIANMEEWRWMPEDLGKYYVMVNIPEFKVRVVKNGGVIHEERIVSGRARRSDADLFRVDAHRRDPAALERAGFDQDQRAICPASEPEATRCAGRD